MRILIIHPSYAPGWTDGGPVVSVTRIAEALAADGAEVRILTSNRDSKGSQYCDAGVVTRNGVKVFYRHRFRPWRYCFVPRHLIDALSLYHWADVVYLVSSFNFTSACTRLLNLLFRRPLIVSPRGNLSPSSLKHTAWLKAIHGALVERPLLRCAAAVQCTTNMDEAWAKAYVPDARTVVIPNGVTSPETLTAGRAEVGSDGHYNVLFMGRFHRVKNLETIIAAFRTVAESNWHLWLVGASSDSYSDEIRRRCADCTQIHIEQFVPEETKWQWYAKAHLVVLASLSENFGNVVVESLRCGVPVVVSDSVGSSPLVAEFGAGIVCSLSVSELGKAMRNAYLRKTELKTVAVASIPLVKRRYSWQTIGAQFMALAQAVAARQSSI